MGGLYRTAVFFGAIWILGAAARLPLTDAGESSMLRVDLYDLWATRVGYALVDQKTGRVEAYDARSRRTGVGPARPVSQTGPAGGLIASAPLPDGVGRHGEHDGGA